jgi:CrcB protein
MMVYSLAVAAGGALGAVSRYWLMLWVAALGATRYPWGTLLVNVLGSCAIGVLYVLITEKLLLTEHWRALLVVGYLGAFTTFSTFSLDALLLLQEGRLLPAAAYVGGSVLLCLAGAWLGMILMRAI